MSTLLTGPGIDRPILAAPMAGGPSTPALVAAVARAGGLGFLAGGYKSAQALAGQIHAVEAEGVPFGVNLFVRNPVPISPEEYGRYARELREEADRYGLTLPDAAPLDDDDHWSEKTELLKAHPVPWVSFTFGIPDGDVITSLRGAGTTVMQCVTTADEARRPHPRLHGTAGRHLPPTGPRSGRERMGPQPSQRRRGSCLRSPGGVQRLVSWASEGPGAAEVTECAVAAENPEGDRDFRVLDDAPAA